MEIPGNRDQGALLKMAGMSSKFFGRDSVPGVFKLLSVNKRLFWPWLYFASKLMPYGKLAQRERELVILRVAWLCRCRYEWGHHIQIGLKNGLTDADIRAASVGAEGFEAENEKALILACDELVGEKLISESTWDLLSRHYTQKMLVEISLLIGNYQLLAGFLNSTGLKLEPSTEQVVEAFNGRIKNYNYT
jgi:alkylhydroperoxidase family enzyme